MVLPNERPTALRGRCPWSFCPWLAILMLHPPSSSRSNPITRHHHLSKLHCANEPSTPHYCTHEPFLNSWHNETKTMVSRSIELLSISFFLPNFHLTQYPSILISDTCFVINRKLLRRRHVRKEQIRRQREAAKRRREAVNRIRTLEQQASTEIKSADSFSDLEALGDTYSNNNNDTQTGDHPAQTITVGNGNSQSNTRTFISTPLPFSPLRSKRRKLVMSSWQARTRIATNL